MAKVSKSFVKAMEKQYPKGATITPKKPVKKADGGMMTGIPAGEKGGPGAPIRAMPGPRPIGGGGGMSRPAMPKKKPKPSGERPIQMGPGFPGGKPIQAPVKPAMPMRRAKGGMAKGKK